MNGILLMESLGQVPWSVVARTHGNSEAVLEGLIASWWAGLSAQGNEVLSGGFTLGKKAKAKKGSRATPVPQCDLLLCMHGKAIGAVELESSKPEAALARLDRVLSSELEPLTSLRFGMLVLQAHEPSGRGDGRTIKSPVSDALLAKIGALSERHPERNIVVLWLDKSFEREQSGLRALNESYWGDCDDVQAALFRGGEEQMRRPYDVSRLEMQGVLV